MDGTKDFFAGLLVLLWLTTAGIVLVEGVVDPPHRTQTLVQPLKAKHVRPKKHQTALLGGGLIPVQHKRHGRPAPLIN